MLNLNLNITSIHLLNFFFKKHTYLSEIPKVTTKENKYLNFGYNTYIDNHIYFLQLVDVKFKLKNITSIHLLSFFF